MIRVRVSALVLAGSCVALASGQLLAQSDGENFLPSRTAARQRLAPAIRRAEATVPAVPPDRSTSTHLKSRKEAGSTKAPAKGHETPSPVTLSPWTTLGALAGVIGLFLVMARLFRKHGGALQPGLPAGALEILGRRFIDQRQAIVLVRLGSRILVLGSSAN